MSSSQQKWLAGFKSTSLFKTSPTDLQERQAKVLAYVELLGQFASDTFEEEVAELIREHYRNAEPCLLDDVLATFVLHHPEHCSTIFLPLISSINAGTLTYSKSASPFATFVSIFGLRSQVKNQFALSYREILRILTCYNRPLIKSESSSDGNRKFYHGIGSLTPWITDTLLATSAETTNDYFQWCVTIGSPGKCQNQNLYQFSSASRWNGCTAVLNVCEDEVSRYQTAALTAAAVTSIFLPSAIATSNPIEAMPSMEPYARLLCRYYATVNVTATENLFFGILRAPFYWMQDSIGVLVQLVELLRSTEDSCKLSGMQFAAHFLSPLKKALREAETVDAAVLLLFRFFIRQLIFPERYDRISQMYGTVTASAAEIEADCTEENCAKEVAALMFAHGSVIENRICVALKAAYGLNPVEEKMRHLEYVPIQITWKQFRPFLRLLKHLPIGSPSQKCIQCIWETLLNRLNEQEARAMVHYLFTETHLPSAVACSLLSGVVKAGVRAFDSYVIAALVAMGVQVDFQVQVQVQAEVEGKVTGFIAESFRLLEILRELLTGKTQVSAHLTSVLGNSKACRHAFVAMSRYKCFSEEIATIVALVK